ncbi:MAG: hypothetical protein ABIG46_01790 [Candidatus Omnitrophota bacterium]|nr:hypothetical protein [Candidatus Omnitrophota bacterium]
MRKDYQLEKDIFIVSAFVIFIVALVLKGLGLTQVISWKGHTIVSSMGLFKVAPILLLFSIAVNISEYVSGKK